MLSYLWTEHIRFFILTVYQHGRKAIVIFSYKVFSILQIIMERLDQGHLHPKLESRDCMSRPGIEPGASAVGGEHSSKELSEQRVNSYS
jgi:hypothetical protein